ncbi:chorismate mutase [Salipaludibacillus agaradhaerens]|jgi:chorismate mutase|uniref:chorismate mutase n=1 Tax=Salipaludibacillus agaradhaerens TaxID=76935 RepID=UPI0009977C2E|nr:chorismate mutase [Salipaludibacillus agaradhaerens]
MMTRGIRGATTVQTNSKTEIHKATADAMTHIIQKNNICPDDISHILITVTNDLDAAFPAEGLRSLEGFQYVPIMCAMEIPVPSSLKKCIRLMVTVNTTKRPADIHHIYLNEAVKLRPDLTLTNEQ